MGTAPLLASSRRPPAACTRRGRVLRAHNMSIGGQNGNKSEFEVPRTTYEVLRVFCSHPSASIPLGCIATVTATRLAQQPLDWMDASGE